MTIAIPPEFEDDEILRWHRRITLEREELRTLRLVLEYERLKFEETCARFRMPSETCQVAIQASPSDTSSPCVDAASQTRLTERRLAETQTRSRPTSATVNLRPESSPGVPAKLSTVGNSSKAASGAEPLPVFPASLPRRRLDVWTSPSLVIETDGELRRELRRAVEKGERRERELAELRAELARISEAKENERSRPNFLCSMDAGSSELREAALAIAMERLKERERDFEDFVASEERRLEVERCRLGRKRDEVISREKKLLTSSIQLA
jgi:hypothetical protein